LDDYRPAYVIRTEDGATHVVPESAIDRIAATGEVPEDMRSVLRKIIEEWKEFVDESMD